jgi:predicted  nucleic acid-binding Zn-ribbon protein
LAVQVEDVALHGLDTRLAALEPRIKALDVRRQTIVDALARNETVVTTEEKKQAFLRDKIAEHKQLIERNQAQFDAVTNLKQATAAATQLEEAKRIVAGEESDLVAINRRLEEARAQLANQQAALAACEAEQGTAREEVAAERTTIDAERSTVVAQRDAKAAAVTPSLLSRYDRIRGKKRVEALYAMRGMSCGACDTAIPFQRRNQMTHVGVIDLCEACGVLMYYAAEASA